MVYGYIALFHNNKIVNKKKIQDILDNGVSEINLFKDIVSRGSKRPNLEILLSICNEGDTIVINRPTSIASSLNELIEIYSRFINEKINLVNIDSKAMSITDDDKNKYNVSILISEFQKLLSEFKQTRNLISISLAKQRGTKLGRPQGLSSKSKIKANRAYELYQKDELTAHEICAELDIAMATFYKYIKIMSDEKGDIDN